MSHRDKFAALVERDYPAPSLAELALLVAAEEYPDLDIASYLAKIDKLATRVHRLQERLRLDDAAILRAVLAEEQGYHGNREEYHDPRNSFLNDVLDRRTGIPITLSILYIETARRAGIVAEGIGFPGHFLVRVGSGDAAKIIDPYNGGTMLSSDDCAMLLARVTGGRLSLTQELLEPSPWRKIVYRLLANLKKIYLAPPQDALRALAVVERMLLVNPTSSEDVRDHSLLVYQRSPKR